MTIGAAKPARWSASLFGLLLSTTFAWAGDITPSDPWPEPTIAASKDGLLDMTLEASPRTVTIGQTHIDGMVYNGLYPGPEIHVSPGDMMRVLLVNRLAEPTNLHVHGIQTTPLGNADNVHVVVQPGESFQYEIPVPKDQPPGLYWYHAHLHGLATHQVTNGLSGTLVVEGIKERLSLPSDMVERVFTLKDVEFPDTDDTYINDELHGIAQTINGRARVGLSMRPGETQLWRFSNQSANLNFHLTLPGHTFKIVAEDGIVLRTPKLVSRLDIVPAARMEALVDAGAVGTYDLRAENSMTGNDMFRVLGRLTVAGSRVAGSDTDGPPLSGLMDLRNRTVTGKRTITFTQDDATEVYRIDGQVYDHERIDVRVPLGSTEEWTLRNDTDDMHVFHIHQLSFQVVKINGVTQPFNGHLDVVPVPERGSVTILMPFTRPQTVGKFVYHCHVLKHEDKGMMANIEVFDPNDSNEPTSSPFDILDRSLRWLKMRLHARTSGLPESFCAL
jgi:FtsP/CotA-like multicopper oxidase with cupredoxin domain